MIIKYTYLLLNYILLLCIALFVVGVLVISNPKTMQYTADKFLKENGLEYSKIEGSLLRRIILHDLKYTGAISIKRLQVDYNPLLLALPTPLVSNLTIDGLTLYADKLPSGESNSSSFSMFPFSISKAQMNKTEIFLGEELLSFDLTTKKIKYKDDLNVEKLALELSTSYAKSSIKGEIKSNELYADSSVIPTASFLKEYLGFLDTPPSKLNVNLQLSLEKALFKTQLKSLKLTANEELSLNNIDVNLLYLFEENSFLVDTSYKALYEEFESLVKQKATFTTEGVYATTLKANLTKSAFKLPFDTLHANISGDTEGMRAKVDAGELELDVLTKEYKLYDIQAKSKAFALSSLDNIPKQFQSDVVGFTLDAVLDIDTLDLKGELDAEDLYSTLKGEFSLKEKSKLYKGVLTPKSDAELFKEYNTELFSPLKFVYKESPIQETLKLDANMLELKVVKKESLINGWGNLGSAKFRVDGDIADINNTNLDITANIASLNTLLNDFNLSSEEDTFVDAELKIDATLNIAQKIELKSKIDMPWYIIKPDSQTEYVGEDLYLEATLRDKEIIIDHYSLNVLNQPIYSQKASKISFDENVTINFEEFWVYENLLITGFFNPLDMEGKIRAQSESFTYESPEGNITAKADINAILKSNGEQIIEGSVTLIEGLITYEPSTSHTISDDIIIIQDIKTPKDSMRSINILLKSLKPIEYKTKDIDLKATPDLVILQEAHSPLGIYGVLYIQEGEVRNSDKVFEFDKSEIYFSGSNPINPYLNLNLHYHTLDYMDIEIYISNTLDDPVIILSSKPYLSQNDILSYILFGEPAASTFGDSEGESSSSVGSILLATGLKQIFNDTTSMKIDTLNILTNEEGTLGYEIGTRFNKQIRMVYKSDTISSIILQYSVNKSVRIDVDVHETGQGINIFYVKDF